MVSQSFAREFGQRGIHVAPVIIDGSINGDKIFSKVPDIGQQKGPDGLLDPDAIADSYWYLHTQHRSAWSQELDVRPYAETFCPWALAFLLVAASVIFFVFFYRL